MTEGHTDMAKITYAYLHLSLKTLRNERRNIFTEGLGNWFSFIYIWLERRVSKCCGIHGTSRQKTIQWAAVYNTCHYKNNNFPLSLARVLTDLLRVNTRSWNTGTFVTINLILWNKFIISTRDFNFSPHSRYNGCSPPEINWIIILQINN